MLVTQGPVSKPCYTVTTPRGFLSSPSKASCSADSSLLPSAGQAWYQPPKALGAERYRSLELGWPVSEGKGCGQSRELFPVSALHSVCVCVCYTVFQFCISVAEEKKRAVDVVGNEIPLETIVDQCVYGIF